MAYKYEKTIKNLMNNAKGVSWTNIKTHKNAYDELLEVYRKAKAFDEIREIEKTSDITGYHEDAQSYMAVLKANVSRLERENEELQGFYRDLRVECYRYHEAFEKIEDRYTALTNHIRLKAEANSGVIHYIDLVNYIDELERE